jgi:hypothetical protein
MGGQREYGEAMTAARKERHAAWRAKNRKVITASGLPFADRGETLLFRGAVHADFYPSTGRWREVGQGASSRTMRGGAEAFLAWLRKRALRGHND